MNKVVLLVIGLLSFTFLHGEFVGNLPYLNKPDNIVIKGNKLYVLEESSILVYSMSDLRFLNKFCQKGEGPKELTVNPYIANHFVVDGDQVVITGTNKILYYTMAGDYIKERRKGPTVMRLVPIKDHFVAHIQTRNHRRQFFAVITLYDQNFDKITILHEEEVFITGIKFSPIPDVPHFAVLGDEIYLEKSREGFRIDVFNFKGEFLRTITQNIPPKKLNEKDKQTILDAMRGDPKMARQIVSVGGWKEYRKILNIHYPKTYPIITQMIPADGKIYIETSLKEKEHKVYFILDPQTDQFTKITMPTFKHPFLDAMMGLGNVLYSISKGTFFYLTENEETDNWELHSVKFL